MHVHLQLFPSETESILELGYEYFHFGLGAVSNVLKFKTGVPVHEGVE